MAIDPRISLAVQQASVAPAIDLFQRTLQQQRANTIQDMLLPGQLQLQQQALTQGQQAMQQGEQALQAGQLNLQSEKGKQELQSIAQFSFTNKDALNQALEGNTQPLEAALTNALSGPSAERAQQALQRLKSGDVSGVVRVITNAEKLAQQTGLLAGPAVSQVTGEERIMQKLREDLKSDDPEIAKAARISLKLEAPAQAFKPQKLSAASEKELITSQNLAVESGNNVGRFELLASDFESADVGGGLFQGSWLESLKDVTGNQDAVTDLRKRYAAIKGSQVVKNLPPGAASDTDIALALEGFPSKNATGKQIASFMRGLAKIERETQRFNEFKSSYISDKGDTRGMLKAWRDEESKNISLVDATKEQPTESLTTNPESQRETTQQFNEGMTATNPQTGERLIFSNGQWRPING